VGRNIAENLMRLGAEVSFVSAIGGDRFSAVMRGFITASGMESFHIITRPHLDTGVYLALLEPGGELYVAVNDMEAAESIGPEDIAPLAPMLARQDLIALDANLREDTLQAIVQAAGKIPIMADAVSEIKARRLICILPSITLLKVARKEAAVIAGAPANTFDEIRIASEKIIAAGVKRLYITLGLEGSCVASRNGVILQPPFPAKKTNVNGAGDAYTSGTIFSCGLDRSPEEGGLFGAACAAITLESDDAVNNSLTLALVEKRIAEFEKG
jgi:pseudouridine kinase